MAKCTCDVVVVFRSTIRLKSGKVLFARQFGKRGFPIAVKSKDCFSCRRKKTALKQS